MTHLDPKALEAARAETRRALMSGEIGTMGAADVAISAYLAALPQAEVGRPIDPKLVRYIEMLRHECAYKGPCSDNGDGCSCSAEELNERHMRSASPTPAEPSPATGVRVKPLAWSETSAPNEYCRYDHCFADTPFGRYLVDWKGWKDYPSYDVDFDSQFIGSMNSLDDAKAAAQADYEARIRSALGEQS